MRNKLVTLFGILVLSTAMIGCGAKNEEASVQEEKQEQSVVIVNVDETDNARESEAETVDKSDLVTDRFDGNVSTKTKDTQKEDESNVASGEDDIDKILEENSRAKISFRAPSDNNSKAADLFNQSFPLKEFSEEYIELSLGDINLTTHDVYDNFVGSADAYDLSTVGIGDSDSSEFTKRTMTTYPTVNEGYIFNVEILINNLTGKVATITILNHGEELALVNLN